MLADLEDAKTRTFLNSQIKILTQTALTSVVGIIIHKPVSEWFPEDISIIDKYKNPSSKGNLLQKDKNGNNVIEYTDVIAILLTGLCSVKSDYNKGYFNALAKSKPDDEDPLKKGDFDQMCEKERTVIDELRRERNSNVGHFVDIVNAGELYIWIKTFLKCMDTFADRIQKLSIYDTGFNIPSDVEVLESFKAQASKYIEQCFSSYDSGYAEFRFGKTKYSSIPAKTVAEIEAKISTEQSSLVQNDLNSLLADMAQNWKNGIRYILNQDSKDSFFQFLKASVDDYDIILDCVDIVNEVKKSNENIKYAELLYKIPSSLSGIYWEGNRYSESYFASLVLQTLTRHQNIHNLYDKIKTFNHRINHLEEWTSDNIKQKGIGISGKDALNLLKFYYRHKQDENGSSYVESSIDAVKNWQNYIRNDLKMEEGIPEHTNLSPYLSEKTIIEAPETRELYDNAVNSILNLIWYMKGKKLTYILPLSNPEDKPRIFQTPKDFRSFFRSEILQKQEGDEDDRKYLDRIFDFIKLIKDDNNLIMFFRLQVSEEA